MWAPASLRHRTNPGLGLKFFEKAAVDRRAAQSRGRPWAGQISATLPGAKHDDVLRYFILVVALLLERSALSPDLIRMASGAIRGPMREHLRTPRLRSRALTRFARNRSQIDLSPQGGGDTPGQNRTDCP